VASETIERFEVRVGSVELAERVLAEVWAAGSSGVEDEGTVLRVYASAADVERVRAAALALTRAGDVSLAEPVESVDWSQEWKRGLTALVISERLVVRPPFVTHEAAPGQLDLVIEPGQAFGTGAHESTRLALDWIDDLYAGAAQQLVPAGVEDPTGGRVLDVGTGSAVLAMAAVGLGAAQAVGVDIDGVAIEEARRSVDLNGFGERVELHTGSLERVAEQSFDLVVANMLRSEVTPLLAQLATRLRAGGTAIFSGLLSGEQSAVASALREVGIEPIATRRLPDASRASGDPGDDWIGLLARRL
jgi:ribosomal protein L11 methyltransferase